MNVNGTTAGVVGTGLDIASEAGHASNAATNVAGVSGALGLITGMWGMGKAGVDMADNGVGLQNSTDMAFNTAGAGAGLGTLLGASGPAAPLAAAAATGYGIGNVVNSVADSQYALDANGQGLDDRVQDSIIQDAIANGEDPESFSNIVQGTVAGSVGQIADAGRGAWNWAFGD
jgi:hypothetical protein